MLATNEVPTTFALKEHEAVQAKLGRATEDIYRVETFVPVAMATVFVWILKDGPVNAKIYGLVSVVLPILALLGTIRYLARRAYIDAAVEYTIKLEGYLYSGKRDVTVNGWENYFATKKHPVTYHYVRLATWVGLTVGSAIFAAWLLLKP